MRRRSRPTPSAPTYHGYGHGDIVSLLSREIRQHGDQAALARRIGILRSDLNMVLRFRRPPCPKVLRYLGLQKAALYVPQLTPGLRHTR